jgi:glutamate dehydrogenase
MAPLPPTSCACSRIRFDPRLPEQDRKSAEAKGAEDIDRALAGVASLDEDRILRRFVNIVQAAIRTNYYQLDEDGQPKSIIAIKFASRSIEALPLPKPLYEGVCLFAAPRSRAPSVRQSGARGIRWSDRPQDFRTEILGLVKAQQVKNAVIVPVGRQGRVCAQTDHRHKCACARRR